MSKVVNTMKIMVVEPNAMNLKKTRSMTISIINEIRAPVMASIWDS